MHEGRQRWFNECIKMGVLRIGSARHFIAAQNVSQRSLPHKCHMPNRELVIITSIPYAYSLLHIPAVTFLSLLSTTPHTILAFKSIDR